MDGKAFSAPGNDDGDVAGHAAGEIDDLVADAVAAGFR